MTAYITASCSSIRTLVSVASDKGDGQHEDAIAIWDTGSESSGISKQMAGRLGMKPLGWKKVIRYANGKTCEENVYLATIFFPSTDAKATLYLFEFDDTTQDVLIGMDIIHCGRFLLEPDGSGGVVFTFSI